MVKLAWLIPLLPFAGFLVNGLLSRRIPVKYSGIIASLAVFLSFVISIILFTGLKEENGVTITLGDWIKAGTISLPVEFLVDRLSVFMLLIVTGVGFLIHVYSIGYMNGDEGYNRFFSYMNLFVFFMTVLVLGANYLIMFVGWEGVGLCSYLLIGFWHRNTEYNNAARKAFVMNRVGDLGFLLGMFLMFTMFGSLSFSVVFNSAAGMEKGSTMLTVLTLLLFAGATGKSAQIPLLTWLPDAMAGPTPVSALIHAATMVTAGVYMVARSGVLYMMAPVSMTVVAITGLLTALLGAVIALYQNDIKKVLAYSTISQLGLMFLGIGTGAFAASLFHLMTHAFFKALLFLAAGSIIHALGGEQDLRRMGGLRKYLPVTFLVFLAAAFAISGIPPFSGFFSKDEILAACYESSPLLWFAAVVVSVFTAFYIFRIFYLVFRGSLRIENAKSSHVHESPSVMLVPLVILAFLSIAGGWIGLPEGLGKNLIDKYFEPVFSKALSLGEPASHQSLSTVYTGMLIVLVLITASILTARYFFVNRSKIPPEDGIKEGVLERIIRKRFYLDEIYNMLFTKPLGILSKSLHSFDRLVIDGFVEWVGRVVIFAGDKIRLIQTGNVGFYLFAMVISILAVLFFTIFM